MGSILKKYLPPFLIIISGITFWAAGCSRNINYSVSDKIPPDIISDLIVVDSAANSVILSWTSPKESDNSGRAAKYDIRYAKSLITEANWDYSVVVGNLPFPSSAGEIDSSQVPGLQGNTNYFFAIKSCDRSGNWSGISNNTIARTGPEHIPAGVLDLKIESRTNRTVTLTWSAPTADDSSSAAVYDLRYSQKALNRFSWDVAEIAAYEGTPGNPGQREKAVVTSLSANTSYYFGLKSQCAGQEKWSDLSNVASIRTREDSSSVTLLGQFDSPGYAMHLALKDHYIFLADHAAGVEIIDVANPSAPTPVKQIKTPGPARKISISGNNMAIIYSDPIGISGIQLYDINNPIEPKLLWQHQQNDLIQDVALLGGTDRRSRIYSENQC